MPRSWQGAFFEKLVEASHAASDPRLDFVARAKRCRPYLALADRVSDALAERGAGATDGLAERVVREIAWFG
jgi:hypothetical protein